MCKLRREGHDIHKEREHALNRYGQNVRYSYDTASERTREMKIKLDAGAFIPVRAHATDAGADLRSPVETVIPARDSCIIDTGVHIQLPHGYVGMLKSKSGLNIKHGITSEGVIDEGYTGPIKAKLYNHSDEPYKIERGDKITQLVIMPCAYVGFELADDLEDSERGDGGFGSTGK